MRPTRHLALLSALTITAVSCTSGDGDPVPTTSRRPAATGESVTLITSPERSSEPRPPAAPGDRPVAGGMFPDVSGPSTTSRGAVVAVDHSEHDGEGDEGRDNDHARYPQIPADWIDLAPLPQAITEQQGRNDPAAVATQWIALKVLTSKISDGTLWPYSVAAHLPALSAWQGQFMYNGRLDHIEVLDRLQPDDETAHVTVAVVAVNPTGQTLSLTYDLELWKSDDGFWLVAFADVHPDQ